MIHEDWYWPGLEPGRLGVRVRLSHYLPDLTDDHRELDIWEEGLRAEVASATAEALSVDQDDVSWYVEISQVGPTAQEFHEVFVWVQELPREILTGLLVLGAERSLAAVYGRLKHRITSIRRLFGGREVTADIEFHSDTLAELCRENAVGTYGASIRETEIWVRKSVIPHNDETSPSPFSDPFLVVVKGERTEYSYLVDSQASVIEHRVDGVKAPTPELIPKVEVPLDDSVPFVIPQGYDWPSQDGVNRSEHIALLAGARDGSIKTARAAKSLLEQATREAVREVLQDVDIETLQAQDHEIGPAAGIVEEFVVTLYENRYAMAAAVGAAVDAWAVYEIVSRVKKKMAEAGAGTTRGKARIDVWMPAGTLAIACEEYVRRNYHPRAHLSTEWYCLTREFYAGYQSPGHPTAEIEYLVIVSTSKESYRFRALGTGKVLSHSVRTGRIDAALPIPVLFKENSERDDEHGVSTS